MGKTFAISAIRVIAAATLVIAAPFAMAGGNVNWSVSVGSPYPAPSVYVAQPPVVYVQPQPIYVQPQPIYVRPQPVYVRPQPVYVQPAAVVQYGRPYYVEEVRYQRGPRHWKHHHHDYRD